MPETRTITFLVTPAEAVVRKAAFDKYGFWMSPAEYRLREAAARLGLEVVSRPQGFSVGAHEAPSAAGTGGPQTFQASQPKTEDEPK